MLPIQKLLSLLLIVFALQQWLPQEARVLAQDKISNRDEKTIQTLEKHVGQMSELLKADKDKPAASAAKKAITQLKKLAKKPNSSVIDKIAPTYQTLKSGYQQIVSAGMKLPALPELPTTAGGGEPAAAMEAVSFVTDVAPILNSKCGNCHVNQKRGNFSLVSFNEISTGGGVISGEPETSRLIEVIESGEMPKGGGKVSKAELDVLKNWIAAGAKYDGDNLGQSIANLAPAAMNTPDAAPLKRPKGNETVSFSADIAPVLVENCQRCHMVNNPRGNLNMMNFAGLLQGGDSGAVIKPGDANGSLLVQRLRGQDVDVMPPNKELDGDLIKKVVTWINEGASFDGKTVEDSTVKIAAIARVNAMTHEELIADRKLTAAQIWKLAMTDIDAETVESKNFLTQGNVSLEKLESVSAMAEAIANQAKLMNKKSDQPFVRGNATIFAFSKRYDFGEFGRMVEQRDFPRSISSTWVRTPERAYVAILMARNQTAADVEVELHRQLSALFVAGRSEDVPRWFADGYGWMQTKKAHSNDETVKSLENRAEEAARKMNKLDDFVNNRIDADQAALVGYLFVKELKKKSNVYNKLMADLDKGQSFEQSFTRHYKLPVNVMLKRMAESARK